jgi:homoserine kinase type II
VSLLARIGVLYAIAPRTIERIPRGTDTQNWRIDTDDASYFLKVYSARSDRADDRATLELAMRAHAAGIRTPRVVPDRDGNLLADDAYALFDFVDASPLPQLSIAQMADAGTELARIHRAFADLAATLPPRSPAWLEPDVEAKRAQLDHYRALIEARVPRDEFDDATLALLPRHRALLANVPRLIDELAGARAQVLHGDYSIQNVLFDRDGRLAAVVDFGPPESFLIAYELGRIAFPPDHVVRAGWFERGHALLVAYRDAYPGRELDVRCAPIAWLVHLMRSVYGLEQHYGTRVEFQDQLDRYWLARARATEILFDQLPAIVGALAGR